MLKNDKIFWAAVVIVIIVGAIYFFAQKPQETSPAVVSETIKIGAVVPLSGDGAAYGLPIQRAAQMAVKEINAASGAAGSRLEVVWEDGKCEAKEATTAAQKLLNVDQVKFILGGVCSSETLAIAPIAERAKAIVFSPSSTSPDITTAGDYIFRTAPSDALAGEIAASYASRQGFKKAAVISENKDYTQGLRSVFKDKFAALGGEVVADEVFNTGDIDFRTQVLKVKAANPEVVYLLPQTPAPGILLLKQLEQNGVSAQLLTAEVLIGRDVVAENAKQMEGLVGIEGYFNEQGEKAAAFLADYEEQYEEKPPFPLYMANMHGQVYLLAEAISQVGADTDKVRDYLYGLKNWQGTMGSLTFDANGDPLSSYAVRKVEQGQLADLELVTPEK